MTHDPVCGMEIKDVSKSVTLVYNNTEYHFCSESCKTKFLISPEKYTKHDDDKEHGHEHHHH